jgi:hypothetical protein
MNQNRRRQCSGLGHCSRGQAHGLQSKQTGQVFRGFRCRRRWARGLWRDYYSSSTNTLWGGLKRLRGNRSAQTAATPNRPSSLITNAA